MLRATSVVRKPAVKDDKVVDTVTLDHEGRHRRRVTLTGEGGLAFLLDLEKAVALGDGDAVKLEDGRLVRVRAAAQPLLEIRAENPSRLMRLAWHIGNRHTPAEITADAIYIEEDHVLAEMVRGQGGIAARVERPFQPERGAYDHVCGPDCDHDHGDSHDHGHAHAHSHSHAEAHSHGHGHAHSEAHSETHSHAHEHGPGCGCGHDHAHDHHAHDTHAHDHGHRQR
ncbi:MAG: urease accessory protein UreE [Microvirga sp.]|nr:urease accessory protein UreE [Microvirga sp.]